MCTPPPTHTHIIGGTPLKSQSATSGLAFSLTWMPNVCVPENLWMWPWHPALAFVVTYCPCDHFTSGLCSSSTAGIPPRSLWSRSITLLSNHSFSRDGWVNGGRSHLNERQSPGTVCRAHFCNSFPISEDLTVGTESTGAFSLSLLFLSNYFPLAVLFCIYFFLLIICPFFSIHSHFFDYSTACYNKKHWFWMNKMFWRVAGIRGHTSMT